MSDWRLTRFAGVIVVLLMSAKNCLAMKSKFIVSKNLLSEFALGQLNLLTENRNFDRISIHKRIAHSKEKLLSKIKFATSKTLLAKFAH
jgi:hypothetical protein